MKKVMIILVFSFSVFAIHCFAQWQQTNGPYGGWISCFAFKDSSIFIGGGNIGDEVFLSTDNGTSWTAMNNGLTNSNQINTIAISGEKIFAGTEGGVFLSTNNGKNWELSSNGLTQQVLTFAIINSNIYAGTLTGGVFKSTDNGVSWFDINDSILEYSRVNSIVVSDTNIFAGIDGGVFLSTNKGKSWTAVNNGLGEDTTNVMSLTVKGPNIFAGTYGGGIFLTTDNGSSWHAVNKGLTDIYVMALAIKDSMIYAGTPSGIFLSSDNGASWVLSNYGLTNTAIEPNAIGINGSYVFVGTGNGGVFLSTDNGKSWKGKGLICTNIDCLAANNTNIFAGTNAQGLFLTTDFGANWAVKYNKTVSGNPSIYSIAISGENIFITSDSGISLSTDNGTNWTAINDEFSFPEYVYTFAINGKNIYAGGYGFYLSTDGGLNWSVLDDGTIINGVNVIAINNDGTNIFVGTDDGGIYLLTDNGLDWKEVDNGVTNSDGIWSLAISGTNVFAGAYKYRGKAGLYLSTDNGLNWSAVNSGLGDSISVSPLAVYRSNIFAGTDDGGVFLSTNNGTSWTAVNDGLTNLCVSAFAFSDSYIYNGTCGAGVWKRPLSEILGINELGMRNEGLGIKVYPNPVDEQTTISYQLSAKSQVNISIYDMMGREVGRIKNGELRMENEGEHRINFDAGSLQSGVYFIKLTCDKGMDVAKFIKE